MILFLDTSRKEKVTIAMYARNSLNPPSSAQGGLRRTSHWFNSQQRALKKESRASFRVHADLKKRKVVKIRNHHSEALLRSIDAFLKIHTFNAQSLTGIAVVSGPGGFSSLRIGITCANTLGWALKVPVFGVKESNTRLSEKKFVEILFKKLKKAKLGIFVEPLYGKEPNITFPS